MTNTTAPVLHNVTYGRGTAVHATYRSEATGQALSYCGAGVVRPNGGATKTLTAHKTDADVTCKTCLKKAPAPAPAPVVKKAPKVTGPMRTANGRLDHSTCTHDRTPKGRAACRKALGA